MAGLKITSSRTKSDMQGRLRRIEGQVRGVQRMLEEERECHEIVQQLNAVRSALQSASLVCMREYAAECLLDDKAEDLQARQAVLDDLISLVGKVR